MKIKITRVPEGVKGSPGEKVIDYEEKAFATDTLPAFRTKVAGKNLMEAGDHFVYLGVPVDEESAFKLAEFKSAGEGPAEIEIWSKEKYESWKNPAPKLPARQKKIPFKITRVPGGVGDSDATKTYEIEEPRLVDMTLADLRPLLESRKYMLADDAFLDQGVVIDKDKEAEYKVSSFADTITLSSKAEREEKERLEKWKADAPAIDLEPYRTNVEAKPITDHQPAKDHTKEAPLGFGGVAASGTAKRFSQLNSDDIQAILRDSRLYPRTKEEPYCSALEVKDDDIDFAKNNIVKCAKVEVNGVPCSRLDSINFSYSEDVQKWQKQIISESKTGASVPLMFAFDASYRQEDQQQRFQKNVTVYLTGSIALPMMRVTLHGVSISKKFTEAVAAAVDRNSAAELLHVLAENGHFVATDFLVGGKVTYWSSKVLDEDYTSNRLGQEFRTAASGSFEAGGVPVTGGGGTGLSMEQKQELNKISQKFVLKSKTYGGQGAASPSRPADLGGEWLKSVMEYPRFWTVIGFLGQLKPTLSYLEAGLQDRARKLLRQYFDQHLIVKMTRAVGNTGAPQFVDNLEGVSQIDSVDVRYDKLVDSMRTNYKLQNGSIRQSAWRGDSDPWTAGPPRKEGFTLMPGEEIAAVEVGYDKSVDHLVFWTSKGRRFPPQENAHYGWNGARTVETLIAPRVRGFHGNCAHFLDALGFQYLDLIDLEDVSKTALVSLEKYIYSR